MKKINVEITVLLKKAKDINGWVAIGMDRYITAQGKTKKAAIKNFGVTASQEVARMVKDPLDQIEAAPKDYIKAYNKVKDNTPSLKKLKYRGEQRRAD